jgi:hypothetical protein
MTTNWELRLKISLEKYLNHEHLLHISDVQRIILLIVAYYTTIHHRWSAIA